MSNSANNQIPYVPENTLDPAAGLNEAIRIIDALLNARVENMTQDSPTSADSVDGICFVVGSSPSGEWAGHAKAIAQYVAEGNFWQFYEAGVNAWLVLNKDDNNLYKYNVGSGAWELAAGIGEAPLDGGLYGRKDGSWYEMPDVSHVVVSVNGQSPDTSGNVEVGSSGVATVNLKSPDSNGDVELLAGDIAFSANTSSGLDSDNVNDAINEVAALAQSGGGSGNPANQTALSAAILALNPKVFYKCDDTVGSTVVADSSGNGKDLTLRGSNVLEYGELVEGGKSLWTDSGATNGANRSDTAGITVPVNYDWSYIAIVAPESTNTGGTFYLMTLITSGETELTNAQFDIYFVYTSNQLRATVLWEYSTGTNAQSDGCLVPNGQAFMFGIRKNTSAKTIDWFVNGRKVYQTSYTNEPTGGANTVLGIHTEAGVTATQGLSSSNHAWFDSALTNADFRDIAKAAGFY